MVNLTQITLKERLSTHISFIRSEFIDALKKLVTNVPEIEPKTVSKNLAGICDYINAKKTSEILL